MQRLILFDIDGTLTSSAAGHIEAHAVAYQKVFDVFGSIHMIDYQGKTDSRITKEVLMKLGIPEEQIEQKLPEFFDAMCDYFDTVKPYLTTKPLGGVDDSLAVLAASGENILGLVTGNLERIARSKLDVAGINDYFKLGGFGNESYDRADLVDNAVAHATEKFGFARDNNVYLIGDTPLDIEAGKNSNVKTIGVATGSYTVDQLRAIGADVVLENLADQAALLHAFDMGVH